ncbi:MAG: PAS domain S-box protein [Nitrospinae bacterium]|nr:PAS domain S-box protein [Nitrospinota bacterium]
MDGIKDRRAPAPGRHPSGILRLFFLLTLPVLAAESIIMSLLYVLNITSPFASGALDLVLLALVLFPLNYLLVYKRMLTALEKQANTEEELRSLTASLEEQVRSRTAKLAASEAENFSVLESSADGIIRIDTKGGIQTANKAAHRMLGYKGMELTGQNVSTIIPSDHFKVLVEGYISFLGGWDGSADQEAIGTEAVKKTGERIAVELTISECIIVSKIYYVIILRDISDRRSAEEALRRSEERYRILVEGGLLVAWEMELSPSRFTYVSRHAEKMLGFPMEEWLKEGFWTAHLHPEDGGWVPQACLHHAARKEDYSLEYRMVAADGRTVWVRDLASVLVDGAGNPAALRGFMIDVTARKMAEEELIKAKNAAEEATRLKDKFVSLVSHDLKGPLGVMLGFIKLVTNRKDEFISEDSRRLLGYAAESGDKMLWLIEDLLNVSRIKTGKIVPRMKFTDACHIVSRVVANNEHFAANKGIRIINDMPANSRIYADESLIAEVLQNIVSNALKFTGSGGNVRIYMMPDKNPTIAVADSGVGIPPDRLKSVFAFEEHTSTPGTANEPGTGLGLPLSREIIAAHGGSVTVESAEGRGSLFRIQLPFARPRVLIVDDEEAARVLLSRHLAALDIEILEARDGNWALRTLAERHVHLVISNVRMPEMDGLELIARLKQNPKLAAIPVIILTADNSMETRDRALGIGADDFSAKPVDMKDLLPRIRRFIG